MSGSRLAEQLERQALALDELLGEDANRYPPALAVAAATTVGLLRATAATVRDEHPDEPAGSDGGSFVGSWSGEIVTLATDAYRDGHRDGWLSCLAAHGEIPDDPDDPATLADAGQVAPPPWGDPMNLRGMLAQTLPRGPYPGRAGG